MLKKQLFIISLLFGVISSAMAADPVKLYGQLQVNGNQLCSEQGEPVVLRGVSYGWHNLWPRFYNKKSVKWLKEDWKCTVLRAAMGTCIEDNYIENPEHALNCINAVVKAAIKNNVYVMERTRKGNGVLRLIRFCCLMQPAAVGIIPKGTHGNILGMCNTMWQV